MNCDYDVLIIGGGLVGGSLALALEDAPLRIGIVEAQTDAERQRSPASDRALAISRGSRQILDALGVWPEVAQSAMPIRHIHVSDRGHFGKTRLHAAEQGVDALGYVSVARPLEDAIVRRIGKTKATRLCPARIIGLKAGPEGVCVMLRQGDQDLNLTTRLLVAADGGNSTVRHLLGIEQAVRDYGQTAIVTEVTTTRQNQHTAYERFTSSGPLAVLPLEPRRSSIVWTLRHEDATELLQQCEHDFTANLQRAFGQWLGTLSVSAKTQGFPLKLVRAESMTDERVVLIGNAMHQLHPVAGQGFNLGLRDAALLADRIKTQAAFGEDIGAKSMLSAYAASRRRDLEKVIRFTDSLVQLFSTDAPPLAVARNIALIALDRIPAAKRLLAGHAMGYGVRL
ncbi:MAG: 2-octaprenyl-6-methoxyphenyl hydroxylase [Methylococcaceae bacterium]|jgi:2-octaprenyl-6-methoxyphenol hydroxylase